MGNNNNQEVLEPETNSEGEKLSTGYLIPGKNPDNVKLQTPGEIKSEMGRIYRAVLKGKTNENTGKVLIRDMLTPMLKATEIEQTFNLAMDDPNADKPAMTGLTITGPAPALKEGIPARSLDAPGKPSPEKETQK